MDSKVYERDKYIVDQIRLIPEHDVDIAYNLMADYREEIECHKGLMYVAEEVTGCVDEKELYDIAKDVMEIMRKKCEERVHNSLVALNKELSEMRDKMQEYIAIGNTEKND